MVEREGRWKTSIFHMNNPGRLRSLRSFSPVLPLICLQVDMNMPGALLRPGLMICQLLLAFSCWLYLIPPGRLQSWLVHHGVLKGERLVGLLVVGIAGWACEGLHGVGMAGWACEGLHGVGMAGWAWEGLHGVGAMAGWGREPSFGG